MVVRFNYKYCRPRVPVQRLRVSGDYPDHGRPSLTSFSYARKVLLGGMLACIGGFYTLNVLLSIPIASALTATPIFITIVLLLIRTM